MESKAHAAASDRQDSTSSPKPFSNPAVPSPSVDQFPPHVGAQTSACVLLRITTRGSKGGFDSLHREDTYPLLTVDTWKQALTNHHTGNKKSQRPSNSAHTQSLSWKHQTEKKENQLTWAEPTNADPHTRKAPVPKPYLTVAGTGHPAGSFHPPPRFAEAGSAIGNTQTCLLARPLLGEPLGGPSLPRKQEGCWTQNPKICVDCPGQPTWPLCATKELDRHSNDSRTTLGPRFQGGILWTGQMAQRL